MRGTVEQSDESIVAHVPAPDDARILAPVVPREMSDIIAGWRLLRKLSAARTFLIFLGRGAEARAGAHERPTRPSSTSKTASGPTRRRRRAPRSARSSRPRAHRRGGSASTTLSDDGARPRCRRPPETPVGVLVPKATLRAVQRAAELERPLVALVEDAAGIRDAHALAEHPAVFARARQRPDRVPRARPRRVGLGALFPRSARRRLRCRAYPAADRRAPPGRSRHRRSSARSPPPARSGCGEDLHPSRPGRGRAGLRPDPRGAGATHRIVVAWAAIVAEGGAVGVVDGMLVDPPVAERARAVIEASEGRTA